MSDVSYETVQDVISSGVTNMTVLTSGTKYDDNSYTAEGVDWFVFNGVTATSVYANGNSWFGFGSSTEHLKMNRRDAAMYYLFREEGTVENDKHKFVKYRWSGYTRYNYSSSGYKLTYDVILWDTGHISLHIVDVPSSYYGSSNGTFTLTAASTITYTAPTASAPDVTFTPQDDDHTTYTVSYELLDLSEKRYLIKSENVYYTATEDKAIVDCLVFDGQQAFKTGIIPTQDTKIEVELNTGTFGGSVVGSRTSATADMFGLFATSATSIQAQYGTQDMTVTVDDYTDTDVTLILSADGLTQGETSIATFTAETFTGTSELVIGAMNTAGTLESYFSGKIKSVTIWQEDTELMRLQPCVDESRVACFCDSVSQTCIYSDVVPTYEDSTGAVDVAYKPLALETIELKAQVFEDSGILDTDIITPKFVSGFKEFTILKWVDVGTTTMKVNLTATPLPQTIISDTIDLTDETITGIEAVTAEYEGTPVAAISFDDKASWEMYDGTNWVTLSDDTTGMQIETLTAITTEQWAEKISGLSAIYLRVALLSAEDKVTNIKFDFTN